MTRAAEVKGTMLQANGWSVDTARDGFEAILFFRAPTHGALLLDYQLPGMDGVDVFNRGSPQCRQQAGSPCCFKRVPGFPAEPVRRRRRPRHPVETVERA